GGRGSELWKILAHRDFGGVARRQYGLVEGRLRGGDDVVERDGLDGLAHQFLNTLGQRAGEDQIGTAAAVQPLAFQRGPFLEVRRRVIADRGAFLEHSSPLYHRL